MGQFLKKPPERKFLLNHFINAAAGFERIIKQRRFRPPRFKRISVYINDEGSAVGENDLCFFLPVRFNVVDVAQRKPKTFVAFWGASRYHVEP